MTLRSPTDHSSIPPAVVHRLLASGWLLAIVGGIALLVLHLMNAFVLERRLLDANGEGTIWTWVSVVATFTIALAAGLRLVCVPEDRWRYGALSVAAAFLSLDDATALHEAFAYNAVEMLGISQAWDSVIWPALYLPLLVAVAVVLETLSRDRPAAVRRQTLVGLALLASAVVLEVVSAPWSGAESLVHTIEGGFEEAAEQAGWVILASATVTGVLSDLVERLAEREPDEPRLEPHRDKLRRMGTGRFQTSDRSRAAASRDAPGPESP